MQVALPCLLYGPSTSHLTLKGGTNADMAPPIDYMIDVCTEHRINHLHLFLFFLSDILVLASKLYIFIKIQKHILCSLLH